MTRADIRNVAASVLARLLTHAKKSGVDYNVVLTSYVAERFLYRLGSSSLRNRFVLKGAMLLRVWSEHPYRTTRDLDLLRLGDSSANALRRDIEAICATAVEPDGLDFDVTSIDLQPIRAEDEYAGTRVTMEVRCGSARIPMQIDVGVGDAVYPPPVIGRYPTLLAMSEPVIAAYARETVIAEKLEAIVVLGARNSRIKDFVDIWYLAREFSFQRVTLTKSIASTFARRSTPMPDDDPIGLTKDYWGDTARAPQLRAFARRAGLDTAVADGSEMLASLRAFLLPVIDDVRRRIEIDGTWPPGGPWALSRGLQ